MSHQAIIYGAYGYTGQLITELAVEKGLKVVIAGRSDQKISALANRFGLNYVVVDTSELHLLDKVAAESSLFINCAGPFIDTVDAVVKYCLEKKLHYIDITGEIEVFEKAKSYDAKASEKGVMIMPGAGFDVVPSDCLAKYLSEKIERPTHLELAFKGVGGASKGTSLTMIRGMHKGGAIRENGKIIKVPSAYEVKKFDFDKPQLTAVTIPWGDVSTAYYSTGIPNIKVFMAMSPKTINQLKITNYLKPILGWSLVQSFMASQVKEGGPSEEVRKKSFSYLVGEVRNEKGEIVKAQLKTIEAYTLTAETTVLIAQKILAGQVKTGYQTPSSAFGYQLILEVRGSILQDL